MTEPNAERPRGWYADPDDPELSRFWNGAAWAGQRHDRHSRAPRPADLTGPPGPGFGLATGLAVALLSVTLGLLLVRIGVDYWGQQLAGDAVASGDDSEIGRYRDAERVVRHVTVAVTLATAAAWLRWQYLLAGLVRPGVLARTPWRQLVAWVVPGPNLWHPFQDVRQLWLQVFPGRSLVGPVCWWSLTVGYAVITGLAWLEIDAAELPADLKGATGYVTFASVLGVAAAVLALWIVLATSRRVRHP